jgi:hypothetical protein
MKLEPEPIKAHLSNCKRQVDMETAPLFAEYRRNKWRNDFFFKFKTKDRGKNSETRDFLLLIQFPSQYLSTENVVYI